MVHPLVRVFSTRGKSLTLPRVAFLVILLAAQISVAYAQSYCGRSSGYYSTEYGYTTTAGLRALGHKLAKSKEFMLISKIDWPRADPHIAAAARPAAIRRFIESNGVQDPKLQTMIDELMRDPRFASMTR